MRIDLASRVLFITLLSLLRSVPSAADDILLRISEKEPIVQAGRFLDQTWYATNKAIYRVEGDIPVLAYETPGAVIAEVNKEVWIGTREGLFRWRDGTAQPHLRDTVGKNRITAIFDRGEEVLIGVYRKGLYRAGENRPIFEARSILSISSIGGNIWVNTESNAYVGEDAGNLGPIFKDEQVDFGILRIHSAGNAAWILTKRDYNQPGPFYKFANGVLSLTPHEGVLSVAEVQNHLWVGTSEGLFKVSQDELSLSRLEGAPFESINSITQIADSVWLTTPFGVHRLLEGGTFQRFPHTELDIDDELRRLEIQGVYSADARTWAWGETGIYRVEEDTGIDLSLSIVSIFGLDLVLGSTLHISEIDYATSEGRFALAGQGDFKAIVRTSAEELENAVKNSDNFAKAENFPTILEYGNHVLHVAVHDGSGNAWRVRFGPVWALPVTIILSIVFSLISTGLLWAAFAWVTTFIALLASRRFLPCMSIVNGRFRRGSFRLIPSLLVWAFWRRVLLRRYLLHLGCEKVSENVGVSLSNEAFCHLSTTKRLQISGDDSEERRSYLRFLTRNLASRQEHGRLRISDKGLKKSIPLYLSLEVYLSTVESDSRKEDLVAGILAKLANFGDINDSELARALLDHGEFVFILDGYEKLTDQGRFVVQQFIEQYERENYIVIGTDTKTSVEEFYAPFPLSVQ